MPNPIHQWLQSYVHIQATPNTPAVARQAHGGILDPWFGDDDDEPDGEGSEEEHRQSLAHDSPGDRVAELPTWA